MANPIKQILLDIIDFVRFKVETDACTPKEMQSVFKMLSENTINKATTKDIADFYGQSTSNVRNIISRWGIKGESKRYYDFSELQEYIPPKWRKTQDDVPSPDFNMAAEPDTEYNKH